MNSIKIILQHSLVKIKRKKIICRVFRLHFQLENKNATPKQDGIFYIF